MHGRRHVVTFTLNMFYESVQRLVSIGFVHVVQRPQRGRHPEVPQDHTQVLEIVV